MVQLPESDRLFLHQPQKCRGAACLTTSAQTLSPTCRMIGAGEKDVAEDDQWQFDLPDNEHNQGGILNLLPDSSTTARRRLGCRIPSASSARYPIRGEAKFIRPKLD
jgi:hypothetical protein